MPSSRAIRVWLQDMLKNSYSTADSDGEWERERTCVSRSKARQGAKAGAPNAPHHSGGSLGRKLGGPSQKTNAEAWGRDGGGPGGLAGTPGSAPGSACLQAAGAGGYRSPRRCQHPEIAAAQRRRSWGARARAELGAPHRSSSGNVSGDVN